MMGLEGLLTGHLLCDRYHVQRVIGRGGMGAVYSARDVRLERAVAVKVISVATADVAARVRLRARFHREARAAARLQHPNVVTVHDFGTDARLDLDFLVMELLRGEDMATRLQRTGPADMATALEILEQAARGIAAGHRLGLIHRDVKPGNLFLAEDGASGRLRVCVLDFGIVQLTADEDEEATATHLTVAGRAPHSPAYAAPEQLRGDSSLTPASDVWGLGVTAFQVLTGERPFTDAEQRRMMDGMPVPAPSARARNPRLPEPLDDVLRIALSYRPADRFRDAAALATALADARRGVVPRIAAAGAAAARPASTRQDAHGPEDDHTLLHPAWQPQPHPSRAHDPRSWVAEPTDRGTLLDPALAGAAPHGPAPVAAPRDGAVGTPASPVGSVPDHPARLHPVRRWLKRAASVAWQLTITAASMAAAVAFGMGMVEAFYNNLTEPFYATVAGLTLSIPWAVHRLFGSRSSYLLAMLGSVAVAVAVFRFLAPLAGPETAVMALGPAQLLASVVIARLTRRRRRLEEETAAVASVQP
jgi:serine/threonine protein kinase